MSLLPVLIVWLLGAAFAAALARAASKTVPTQAAGGGCPPEASLPLRHQETNAP
jgi:hypothetical protein